MIRFTLFAVTIFISFVSADDTKEIFDIHNYSHLRNQKVFISQWAIDSSELQANTNEIILRVGSLANLSGLYGAVWSNSDWVSIRLATLEDTQYLWNKRAKELCIKSGLDSKCLIPPVTIQVGGYRNYDFKGNAGYFSLSNEFCFNITDSAAIALNIDTLFDGISYGNSKLKAKLNRNNVKQYSFQIVVTSGTTGYENYKYRSQQFDTTFTTYPTYRLFHIDNGEGVFVISGGDPENEGDLVCEFSITKMGGQYKNFFNDLVIGDSVVHQTIYSVDGSYVKRNRIETDEKTGRRMSYKARYHGMWLPDNEKESK